MVSITIFALSAVAAGLFLSGAIGIYYRGKSGFVISFGLLFLSGVMGVALLFVVGLSHAFCDRFLKMCEPTSDITVWSISYPLMAVPLYWFSMLILKNTGNADESL